MIVSVSLFNREKTEKIHILFRQGIYTPLRRAARSWIPACTGMTPCGHLFFFVISLLRQNPQKIAEVCTQAEKFVYPEINQS